VILTLTVCLFLVFIYRPARRDTKNFLKRLFK